MTIGIALMQKGEPMNDLISRAEAIELKPEFLNPNVNRETKEQTAIDRAYARGWNSCNTHWIKEIIEDLPSAQPEPCEDAVSRKMAMDAITASTPYCVVPDDYHISVVDMEFRISTLPSVTPKQKTGKWEEKAVSDEKVIDEWQSARCSACGKYHTAPYMYYFNNYNFCPNCGADMRGEQE